MPKSLKRLRIGLRGQFIVLITLILATLTSLTTYVIIRTEVVNLRKSLTAEAGAFAELATKPIGETYAIYKDSGSVRIEQGIESFMDLSPNISNVVVADTDGKVLFSYKKGLSKPIEADSASANDTKYITNSHGELTRVIRPYIESFGAHRYTLAYDVSNDAINSAVRNLINNVLRFSLAGFILSAILTYQLINRLFLKPIKHVSDTALEISQGSLDKQVEVTRHDEIADLGIAVNTMSATLRADIRRLEELDKLKSEFLMIASHNLRTPVTVIKGNLDLLASTKLPADAQEFAKIANSQASMLGSLAEDMLTISTLELGNNTINKKPGDLTKLAGELADQFRPLITSKKLTLNYKPPLKPINVSMSAMHIKSALTNLLENALKFTQQGSISLALETNGDDAMLSVSDSGIGISSEEQKKLFTKFHRGTSTLIYDYEGAGIGLYVTKLIVSMHSGTISVVSSPEKGSTFTIKLPLIKL